MSEKINTELAKKIIEFAEALDFQTQVTEYSLIANRNSVEVRLSSSYGQPLKPEISWSSAGFPRPTADDALLIANTIRDGAYLIKYAEKLLHLSQ